MRAYAIVRRDSDETIAFPVCADCMPRALIDANTMAYDAGFAHARAIKTVEHNRRERCDCGALVKRAPRGGNRAFGNRWEFT